MAERLIEVGDWPKCPRCGWDQFDDWWHALDPVEAQGHLRCECGRFKITGAPGRMVMSECFGARKPDYRHGWTGRPMSASYGIVTLPSCA